MSKVERVFVDSVEVGSRHRTANPEKVSELAASMKRLGQLQPITVFTEDNETVLLVAGLHRLRAAASLGWDMLDAIFVTGDKRERKMMEIAENLHRADLTKDERDRQIREYAELLGAGIAETARTECPTSLSDGRKAGPQHKPGIASQIAAETGISQRTVRRALNPVPPKPAADPLPDMDASEKQVARLMAAWNAAGPDARQEFLCRIDGAVFDRSRNGGAA